MPNRRIRVLALAGDPGGAEAIAPVISALKHDSQYCVDVYSYRQATTIFARQSLEPKSIIETATSTDFKCLLESQQTDVAVCATSVNGIDLEKHLILAAKQCKTPVLSVIDFWSNYRLRYLDSLSTKVILPDRIAVPDDRAKEQIISAGFPPDGVVVTGQPALDRLLGIDNATISAAEIQLRRDLGVEPKTTAIVFVSQPLAEFYGGEQACYRTLGFTEHSVFQLVQEAVELVRQSFGQHQLRLIVQTHPRESTDVWKKLQDEQHSFVVNPLAASSFGVCMGASIVIGMNSMLLLEMRFLGKRVISIEPRSKSPLYDGFPEIGVITGENAESLAMALAKSLQSQSPSRLVHEPATARVVEQVKLFGTSSIK